MGLKTVVKVSEINNLSDARYCAGMGVEMLGFSLDENHPKFIELAKLREIALWISGVKVVGEFTGENVENINYLAHELKLDYVQLNHPIKSELVVQIKKPIIQKLNLDEYNLQETENFLNQYKNYVQYFLLENNQNNSLDKLTSSLKSWCSNYPIILGIGIKNENLNFILNDIKPVGIELRGGNEIKPGLKSFDELSSILELLEVED
jgi:phosphoribosylanthranilate isomerase